jgi:hypothetical protein
LIVAVVPAKAGTQYAAAARLESQSRGVLDRPVKPGDDSGKFGENIIVTLPAAA